MSGPPPNAPGNGKWINETYAGQTSIIIFVVLCFLCLPGAAGPFCCPCDQRARP